MANQKKSLSLKGAISGRRACDNVTIRHDDENQVLYMYILKKPSTLMRKLAIERKVHIQVDIQWILWV